MLAAVDPLEYLTDVFQKLSAGWPHRRLDELLPRLAVRIQTNRGLRANVTPRSYWWS
jgi:hypothetical protein